MVRCNLIKLGVGWPEMWPERTDLRHKLVRHKLIVARVAVAHQAPTSSLVMTSMPAGGPSTKIANQILRPCIQIRIQASIEPKSRMPEI